MNNEQLTAYYDKNNIQSFHGEKVLDALKYLSELNSLPNEVREDYYNQYTSTLSRMGTSNNRKLGDWLYERFVGENPIEVGDVMVSYTYKGITFNAVQIKFTHYTRMAEYFKQQGIPCGRIKDTYTVLDIRIGNHSTLQSLLNKSNKGKHKYCIHSVGTLFLSNEVEYALVNSFYKPYNGIEAERVVEIFKEQVKNDARERYTNSNLRNYVERMPAIFSFYIDVAPMIEEIKTTLKN